jgi:hypothetical protein
VVVEREIGACKYVGFGRNSQRFHGEDNGVQRSLISDKEIQVAKFHKFEGKLIARGCADGMQAFGPVKTTSLNSASPPPTP